MKNGKYYLGIDIGGTKCAVCAAIVGDDIQIIGKTVFPTHTELGAAQATDRIISECRRLCKAYAFISAGVSCGSPLDIGRGIIMSPPNLPGWDNIPIASMISDACRIPCAVRNDADACALAEYRFGAGRGCRNMIFCTFGTGLGAGLILNGALYTGKSGTAGEIGHIRLTDAGPVGYGKAGSFEGYCSGGGIAQLAREVAAGRAEYDGEDLTAKRVSQLADAGDPLMKEVYRKCGRMLGRGLAVLADTLDPDVIVLGSIFTRSENLLRCAMWETLEKEALPLSLRGLRIVPALLGDSLGDFAAISVAQEADRAGDNRI